MSWNRENAGPDEIIEHLKELKKKMQGNSEATDARLKASEERVKALLRENADMRRRLQTGYHFTKEQLTEHDKQVSRQAVKNAEQYVVKKQTDAMEEKYAEHMKRFEKESEEFWEKAQSEFKKGSEEENFWAWCRVMWAIPIEVLVETFGWKPLTEECCGDNRQNLVKFCNKCVEIISRVSQEELIDIRTYCKNVAEKYGVGFVVED